ncbi:hypothetical protein [Bacteroides faecis]|uniref:hypothetical protein n=1 Tax=Bacteroides faecis TaxID=674529 RepID=UPI002165EA25|nr:hypothetical protein [Bacteroides faecis]MCS2576458.1 hypothetical protein [Bacteroides faecis]
MYLFRQNKADERNNHFERERKRYRCLSVKNSESQCVKVRAAAHRYVSLRTCM